MKITRLLTATLLLSAQTLLADAQMLQKPMLDQLDAYNVRFDSPARDEADSVPLGNGKTGINLWAEQDGDLIFYVSHNDALSEMQRLLKLGRIRMHFSNNPFAKGAAFNQVLQLQDGACEIVAGVDGNKTRLKIFVDSDSQTIYVTATSDQPIAVEATLENWRTEKRVLGKGEIDSSWIYRGGVREAFGATNAESADVIQTVGQAITWYHRNDLTPVPAHIKGQHLEAHAASIADPILHRTSGAALFGPGFTSAVNNRIKLAQPSKSFHFCVATHVAQTETPAVFMAQLNEKIQSVVSPEVAAERTGKWWHEFWERSWVFVNEPPMLVPGNKHTLHFGAGRNGDISIGGEYRDVRVMDRVVSVPEVRKNAKGEPEPVARQGEGASEFDPLSGASEGHFNSGYLALRNSKPLTFGRGFTMEAWIKPSREGRIFDKVTPGQSDGMLFDILQGKLRLIVGAQILYATQPIPLNEWTHVCAVADPTGRLAIYQNGQLVGEFKPDAKADSGSNITRSYILTRYQFACQERSEFPAHFNGGIFTVAPEFAFYATDPRGKNWGPDYRFYGCNLWWQNTRFMYQANLAQGSFDLTDSFYDYYFRNQKVFESLPQAYFGAKGLYMNETLSLFGLPGMGDFEWGHKEYNNAYTRNIWQQALEFGSIALDRYDYTQDEAFGKKTIDWCDKALIFYDTRFKKDEAGKIVIFPSHGVETYWDGVTGDMPSIAGLHEITSRLLALPAKLTTPEERERWQRIARAIPEIPKTKNKDGLIVPDVAQKYDPKRSNYEAPDLYCIYPFRIYGLNRPQHDIEEARRGWEAMAVKGHVCWYQTGVFAARLGLADGAKEDVLLRASPNNILRVTADKTGRRFRFPGFFDSPHDWCPDYDGPGNMCNTLQEMLIQPAPDNKLLLMPAWPKDWDVTFKLHAPGKTSIECVYANGKVQKYEVTPKEREKDVIRPEWLK